MSRIDPALCRDSLVFEMPVQEAVSQRTRVAVYHSQNTSPETCFVAISTDGTNLSVHKLSARDDRYSAIRVLAVDDGQLHDSLCAEDLQFVTLCDEVLLATISALD